MLRKSLIKNELVSLALTMYPFVVAVCIMYEPWD